MNKVFILQRAEVPWRHIKGLYGVSEIFCFLIWVLAEQLGSTYKKFIELYTYDLCTFLCVVYE